MSGIRRPGASRAVVGLSFAGLIVAALLFGRRDWGPAIGVAAGSVAGLAAGIAYLLSRRRGRGSR